jgi:hypothetical protein
MLMCRAFCAGAPVCAPATRRSCTAGGHADVGGKRWLPETPTACHRRLSSGERGGSVTRLGPSPWEAVGPHPCDGRRSGEKGGGERSSKPLEPLVSNQGSRALALAPLTFAARCRSRRTREPAGPDLQRAPRAAVRFAVVEPPRRIGATNGPSKSVKLARARLKGEPEADAYRCTSP